MKVAIITDTHYGARKGSKYLHDYFELFYKNVFFPTLEEQGVEAVIQYVNNIRGVILYLTKIVMLHGWQLVKP